MTLTIDYVTDNGDNSLTIIGHDQDGTEYQSSMGRKTDLPSKDSDKMAYYRNILCQVVPKGAPVLYQAPGYTPPTDEVAVDESVPSDKQ